MDTKKTYEVIAKKGKKIVYLDESTGEVEDIKPKEKANNGMVYNNPNAYYKKNYTAGWKLLETQLNEKEYKVAHKLSLMAIEHTNSLKPLTMDMSARELSRILDINRNKVKQILNKLLDLGVIGAFSIAEADSPDSIKTKLQNYLIFNPYLSFSGQVINRQISSLFSETVYAMIYNKKGKI